MRRRLSVRGIVFHEGKLLCVKLKPYHGAMRGDFWCTPGGGLDPGEALIPGTEREMLEETGIAADVGALLYIQQFMHEGVDNLDFFFHIRNSADYLRVDLSKTTHGADEIERIELIDPATAQPLLLPKFLQTEDIAAHISSGATAKIFSLYE